MKKDEAEKNSSIGAAFLNAMNNLGLNNDG